MLKEFLLEEKINVKVYLPPKSSVEFQKVFSNDEIPKYLIQCQKETIQNGLGKRTGRCCCWCAALPNFSGEASAQRNKLISKLYPTTFGVNQESVLGPLPSIFMYSIVMTLHLSTSVTSVVFGENI